MKKGGDNRPGVLFSPSHLLSHFATKNHQLTHNRRTKRSRMDGQTTPITPYEVVSAKNRQRTTKPVASAEEQRQQLLDFVALKPEYWTEDPNSVKHVMYVQCAGLGITSSMVFDPVRGSGSSNRSTHLKTHTSTTPIGSKKRDANRTARSRTVATEATGTAATTSTTGMLMYLTPSPGKRQRAGSQAGDDVGSGRCQKLTP
jgi:hypothetical protein